MDDHIYVLCTLLKNKFLYKILMQNMSALYVCIYTYIYVYICMYIYILFYVFYPAEDASNCISKVSSFQIIRHADSVHFYLLIS